MIIKAFYDEEDYQIVLKLLKIRSKYCPPNRIGIEMMIKEEIAVREVLQEDGVMAMVFNGKAT